MDLNSDAWRDLIFEGRNKRFGAYYLRKTSSKRHLYALLIVIGSVIVISIGILLFVRIGWNTNEIDLKPASISNLIVMTEYNYENPKTPDKEIPAQKHTNTSLQIVDEDNIIIEPLKTDKIELSYDTAKIIPPDSILFEKSDFQKKLEKIKHKEISEDQNFNQADSLSEIQALLLNMRQYVYRNLKYPDVAYKQKIQGNVIYSFFLNQDGSISDIELIKGVYIFLDEEALRVIRSMPVWQPIKKEGKPIRVKCYLPINFSL